MVEFILICPRRVLVDKTSKHVWSLGFLYHYSGYNLHLIIYSITFTEYGQNMVMSTLWYKCFILTSNSFLNTYNLFLLTSHYFLSFYLNFFLDSLYSRTFIKSGKQWQLLLLFNRNKFISFNLFSKKSLLPLFVILLYIISVYSHWWLLVN